MDGISTCQLFSYFYSYVPYFYLTISASQIKYYLSGVQLSRTTDSVAMENLSINFGNMNLRILCCTAYHTKQHYQRTNTIPSSRRIGVLVNWNLYSKERIFYPKPMSVHEGVLVYLHSKRYTILFLTRQVLTQVLRVLSIRNTDPEGEHFHTKSCLITRECYDIYSISSYC